MVVVTNPLHLCLLSLPLASLAWGPVFEPVRGCRMLTIRKVSDNDDHSEGEVKRSRGRRNISEEDIRWHRRGVDPLLWDEYLYDDIHELDFGLTELPSGDDGDDCLIPEEFKRDREEKIDVMAFLGIRRAEPLRVDHESHDWQ